MDAMLGGIAFLLLWLASLAGVGYLTTVRPEDEEEDRSPAATHLR